MNIDGKHDRTIWLKDGKPTWIEMLLRVPMAVEGDISVYHYSKAVRLESRHQIVALGFKY